MKTFINQSIYLTEFSIHKKYASSDLMLDLVWTHCNIVADIALNLITKNNLDQNVYIPGVVLQSALMHDIGVYVCEGFEWLSDEIPPHKPYIQHTVAGAWILQQEGFGEEVVKSAHSHAGVGISRDDIKNFVLHLPDEDYTPVSPIQRLICYAGKFHSKTPKFKHADEIKESLKKYGHDKQIVFGEMEKEFGLPDLPMLIEKYKEWHRAFKYEVSKATNNGTGPNLNSAGIPIQASL